MRILFMNVSVTIFTPVSRIECNLQYCHEDGEPQLLRVQKCVGICPPLAKFDVVAVTQDNEDPGGLFRVRKSNS